MRDSVCTIIRIIRQVTVFFEPSKKKDRSTNYHGEKLIQIW